MADLNTIQKYIYDNKSLVLSTVDEVGNPQLRHIGGYTIDGKDILFQTGAGTDKTREIAGNNNVALLFQHEGQRAPKNITIYGHAKQLDRDEAEKASELIKERRPQINYDPEVNVIFRVETDSVKILDFASEEKQKVYFADELE
jgi:pyridoxine/pyridoxamine 5'-phosphate oxidase